jgi:hypothetical protein
MEENAGPFVVVVSSTGENCGAAIIAHHRLMRKPGAPTMLRLSDDQISIITKLAEPLLHVDRGPFLTELLRGHEIGDGVVYRCAEQAQKEFRRQ